MQSYAALCFEVMIWYSFHHNRPHRYLSQAGQCGNQMGTKFWQLVRFLILCILLWILFLISGISGFLPQKIDLRLPRNMGWTRRGLTVATLSCSLSALRLRGFFGFSCFNVFFRCISMREQRVSGIGWIGDIRRASTHLVILMILGNQWNESTQYASRDIKPKVTNLEWL